MSLQFSDTTGKDGIIQFIEETLGFPDGYISGDTTRLKKWTGSINLAMDKVFHVIFRADGKFNFDDKNHTDNPIIFIDLDSTQKNYSFTADANSNVVLDFHKVMARQSTTSPYYTLTTRDAQSEDDDSSLTNGLTTTGWPSEYDKTANGINLDTFAPSNVTRGLKIYINREGSYFTTSDTTKTPGFAGLYHEYLILEACYRYARGNGLKNQETLKRDLLEMKADVLDYYSKRSRDERTVMEGERIIFI